MESKEIIKKTLQEQLRDKSRDELIDIIVDMSSVHIITRAAVAMASAFGKSCTSEVRTDLQSIVNQAASTIADTDNLDCQVCKIDIPYPPLK